MNDLISRELATIREKLGEVQRQVLHLRYQGESTTERISSRVSQELAVVTDSESRVMAMESTLKQISESLDSVEAKTQQLLRSVGSRNEDTLSVLAQLQRDSSEIKTLSKDVSRLVKVFISIPPVVGGVLYLVRLFA